MTSLSRPCGCRYVHAGPSWYQVVACPAHDLEMRPLGRIEIPQDAS